MNEIPRPLPVYVSRFVIGKQRSLKVSSGSFRWFLKVGRLVVIGAAGGERLVTAVADEPTAAATPQCGEGRASLKVINCAAGIGNMDWGMGRSPVGGLRRQNLRGGWLFCLNSARLRNT